jgi:hypothetical protein
MLLTRARRPALTPHTLHSPHGMRTYCFFVRVPITCRYANNTPTSDRMCSICSTCPDGYVPTECTASTDTKCTKEDKLSVATIVAIVLALVIFLGVVTGVSLYLFNGKKRKEFELGKTNIVLRNTAEDLEKNQAENAQMERAWSIPHNMLTYGKRLGSGASATIYTGMWG